MESPMKKIKIEEIDNALHRQTLHMRQACKPHIDAIRDAIKAALPHRFVDLNDMMVTLLRAADDASAEEGHGRNMQPDAVLACFEHVVYPHHGACVLLAARSAECSAKSIYCAIRERSSPATWDPIGPLGDGRPMPLSDMYVASVAVVGNMDRWKDDAVRRDEGRYYTLVLPSLPETVVWFMHFNNTKIVRTRALCYAATMMQHGPSAVVRLAFQHGAEPDSAERAREFRESMRGTTITECVNAIMFIRNDMRELLDCMFWDDLAKMIALARDMPRVCKWTMTPIQYRCSTIPAITVEFEMARVALDARNSILAKGKEVDPGLYGRWVSDALGVRRGERPSHWVSIFADKPLDVGTHDTGTLDVGTYDTLILTKRTVRGREWQVAYVADGVSSTDPRFVRDHTDFLVKHRPGVISAPEAAAIVEHFERLT